VTRPPDVSYARSGDVAIAYQQIGDGDRDIVFARGFTGDLLSTWEQPLLVRHVVGLASLGRVLMLDRRGTGLSDRTREVPSVESSMDDIRAVMDHARSEQAVIWTGGSATGIAALYAATYPERVAGLILFDPRARGSATPDYPWAPSEADQRERLRRIRDHWGERRFMEDLARELAPERADDPDFREWLVWHLRRSLSPGAAVTAARFEAELDLRDVLGAVRVPTMLLAHPARPAPAYYIAGKIKDASVIELPELQGIYTWVDDACHEATMAATADFMARLSGVTEPGPILATLMLTDIEGSTELVARLGDAEWRKLIEHHHSVVRTILAQHAGREIDTAGDGFFASFDGPTRAVLAALQIVDAVGAMGLAVRVGLHTGEFEVADGKLAGLGVSVGARIAAMARGGEVLVSGAVRDLVASPEVDFEDRGTHHLRGIPDGWPIYAVQVKRAR
jgi:class 3 adenylate cyclase